ncbi:peptide ABC transporter permease [Paenibacillus contaminans]|uniref:Peptide ABC transporter permease n=2 Tax=Paenibacillus contaminans TaxID=450362 RepID=A0A329MLV4_9BACL|nr:peptide ABC transporter permease [Paenibacillus contaminans]
MAGFSIIAIMSLAAILAPLLTSYSPNQIDLANRAKPPSWEHWMGTDKIGRDVFARLLYGARISILIGLSGALGGAVIGSILGCFSGYFGGWFDKIMLRVSEIFMTFPQIVLILILVVFLGQGLFNLIFIFAITGWTGTYRLVRGRFFSLREESYVEACRAFGIGEISIMFRHILPNTLSPVIVSVTLATAGFILAESGLSFLGLGVPSGIPTWGNIINAAKSVDVIQNNPWLWLPPGLAISLFVLGVNFFGDGLRDVLDPNQ